jgi:hypothetical protein
MLRIKPLIRRASSPSHFFILKTRIGLLASIFNGAAWIDRHGRHISTKNSRRAQFLPCCYSPPKMNFHSRCQSGERR